MVRFVRVPPIPITEDDRVGRKMDVRVFEIENFECFLIEKQYVVLTFLVSEGFYFTLHVFT